MIMTMSTPDRRMERQSSTRTGGSRVRTSAALSGPRPHLRRAALGRLDLALAPLIYGHFFVLKNPDELGKRGS